MRARGRRRRWTLAAGEEIRTELSCKYTRESFAARLPGTGLEIERWTTDADSLFAVGAAAQGVRLA